MANDFVARVTRRNVRWTATNDHHAVARLPCGWVIHREARRLYRPLPHWKYSLYRPAQPPETVAVLLGGAPTLAGVLARVNGELR